MNLLETKRVGCILENKTVYLESKKEKAVVKINNPANTNLNCITWVIVLI